MAHWEEVDGDDIVEVDWENVVEVDRVDVVELDFEDVLEVGWEDVVEVDWEDVLEVDWEDILEVDWEDVLEVDWEDILEVDWEDELEVDLEDILFWVIDKPTKLVHVLKMPITCTSIGDLHLLSMWPWLECSATSTGKYSTLLSGSQGNTDAWKYSGSSKLHFDELLSWFLQF